MTIKLIETDSEFLEVAGTKFTDGGREFYYLPYWYEKVGEHLYKQCSFENLPESIIDTILPNRPQ